MEKLIIINNNWEKMKRSDFKKITRKHFRICKRIIKNKGACYNIECNCCPFVNWNAVNNERCVTNKYANDCGSLEIDLKLVESAKEFLKFKNPRWNG